jgi:hypothetical protein
MELIRLNQNQKAPDRMGGIHRRYRRGKVAGLSCDIADGNRIIGGVIENISANGFKMSQVDDTFPADEFYYQTIVSGNGRHYKIIAKPCWTRDTDTGREIGFKIVDASWEWTEFVLQTVPEKGGVMYNRGNT